MNQKASILQTVLESDSLPVLPVVASKLLAVSGRDDAPVSEIADLVSRDIALSSKILRVVNSAFYNFPSKISSIQKAVAILGTRAVRSLVLSFSLLSIKGDGRSGNFDYQKFWEKSLATGVSAKLIMARVRETDPEEIFSAGLLQNLGELIVARTLPDHYARIFGGRPMTIEAQLERERRLLGFDHCRIGAEVAKKWRLPETLQAAIYFHHALDNCPEKRPDLKEIAAVVYLSGLVAEILYSGTPEEYHRRFVEDSKKLLGFDGATAEKVESEVHREVNSLASYFGLDMTVERPIGEILQEANLRLSQINMSYDQINRELVRSKMQLLKLTKELEEKNAKLENLANLDGLTEVYNHRYFQNFLSAELKRAVRHETNLSLLLLDVDNFKKFNDNFGHLTGDFILRELCVVIKALLREYDLLARYGGEEFAVVLPETDADGAQTVAEKVRAAVADHCFRDADQVYSVTVSIGMASLQAGAGALAKDELIQNADRGLLSAKRKGKNRIETLRPKIKLFGRTTNKAELQK